jgi:hypothetical protein
LRSPLVVLGDGINAVKNSVLGLPASIFNSFNSTLSNLITDMQGVRDNLTGIPQLIFDMFYNSLVSLQNGLTSVKDAVTSLGDGIIAVKDSITGLPQLIYDLFSSSLVMIQDKVQSVIDSITGLPQLVFDKFNDALTNIKNAVQGVIDGIAALPQLIIDGIGNLLKYLFIPSDTYFFGKFESIKAKLEQRLGTTNAITIIQSLDVSGAAFEDVTVTVLGQQVTIINMDYINMYLPTIRNWIRGFFYFLLALYGYNQLYFLLRGTYPIKVGGGGSGGGDQVSIWDLKGGDSK